MTGFDYGDMTPESTRQAASPAAEAVRYLNHATRGTAGIKYPADVDEVLVNLESLAECLPQLLGQLGAWLVTECQAGRLKVVYGTWAHSPSTEALAVSAVRQYLTEASARAEALREVLHDARQITAAIAASPGDGDEGEQ